MTLGFGFGFPRRWPGATVWTPAVIQTALWLDANDTSTITLNGSTVSQWNDKSGNGRNAVQATAANQPGWGRGRNLLLWSEQFQQSAWAKEGMAIGQDAILAPNNTLTADKIVPNSTAGVSHVVFNATAVAVVNGVAIWTVRAKAGEYNFITVGCAVPAGRYTATFNLTTGAVTKTATAGTPTDTSNSAIDLGNGWWQLSVTATTTSATSSYILLGASASGTPTQDPTTLNVLDAGDGVSGVFIWGAQLNPGTTVDSYQKTESTAFTDSIGINGKPALTFDGSNDSMTSSTGSYGPDISIYAVTSLTSGIDYKRLINIGTTDLNGFFGTGGSGQTFFATFFGNPATGWNDISANTPNVSLLGKNAVVGVVNGANVATPYVDGTAQNTKNGAMATATGVLLGSQPPTGQFWPGPVGEIVITNYALSTVDRQKLEGYLAWKWGGV